jgi:ParB family chromosome partitioning protein
MASKPLGRGLGALLGSNKKVIAPQPTAAITAPGDAVLRIPLEHITPCAFQPRKTFDDASLQELAESIKSQGILTPLVVRPVGDDRYEIIAGERRWRASHLAGLRQVPVLVRKATDEQTLELALIENLQRADLNPVEEAEGYAQLQAKFKLTQAEIAERVGKPRATVANALRLLDLDTTVRGFLTHGQISTGHAKALLGLKDKSRQRGLADRVIRQGLSVRATEQLVAAQEDRAPNRTAGSATSAARIPGSVDPVMRDLQNRLRQRLGTQVFIHPSGDGGRIEIQYFSNDDLSRIADVLGTSD